jgi:hypothetical protein
VMPLSNIRHHLSFYRTYPGGAKDVGAFAYLHIPTDKYADGPGQYYTDKQCENVYS